VIALLIGPVGYGIIFQFYNFFLLFTSSLHLGTPVGLLAQRDSTMGKKGSPTIDNYFLFFIRLFLLVSLVLTIVFIFFSKQISYFLIGESSNYLVFSILILGTPAAVSYSFVDAYLKNKELIGLLVKITIISSIVSIIVLFPSVILWGVYGAAVVLFISSIIPILIFGFYKPDFIVKIFTEKIITITSIKVKILKIGSVSLLSSFMFIGSFIILRKIVIDNLGLLDNGIFQSVITLSNSSFVVVYSFLSSYLLPKISKLENYSDIAIDLDNGLRFVIFMVVPILIFVFLYRYTIISLVYSAEFSKAGDLIFYQFMGDSFKCLSSLFGLWMISKMKIKYIMLFDFILNFVLLAIPITYFYILNYTNIAIVPIAYMIALFLHFLLYYTYSYVELKYRMSNSTMKAILLSVIAVLICFGFSYFNIAFQMISAPILIIIYLYTTFSKNERTRLIFALRNFAVR